MNIYNNIVEIQGILEENHNGIIFKDLPSHSHGNQDLSLIQSFYGTNPLRVNATKKALTYLLKSNPFPKDWIFVESQLDESRKQFQWLQEHGIKYVFVKCTLEQFKFMFKPALWNIGTIYATHANYCFLDSDVMFCNSNWINGVIDGFNDYDVFSPQGWSYDEMGSSSILRKSIGRKYIDQNSIVGGHPGYGICVTKQVFDSINGFDSTLTLDDIWNYVRILGKDIMHPFNKFYPNDIDTLNMNIRFGSTQNILCHCWHGSRDYRKFDKIMTDISRNSLNRIQMNKSNFNNLPYVVE